LIGITLHEPDEYASIPKRIGVYHDGLRRLQHQRAYDGWYCLLNLLISCEGGGEIFGKKVNASASGGFSYNNGAIIRGDSTKKQIAHSFTSHKTKTAYFLKYNTPQIPTTL
jgi:hypothetical protein